MPQKRRGVTDENARAEMHLPSTEDRAQVVHVWLWQALMLRLRAGGFSAPGGIQAHVVTLLAEAMQSYEHCKYDQCFTIPVGLFYLIANKYS